MPGTNGGLVREEDLRRSDLFRMPWVCQLRQVDRLLADILPHARMQVEEAVTVKEGVRIAREADIQREMAIRQAREKEALRQPAR